MYRLNPFVHKFEKENVVALYNAVTLATVYLPQERFYTLLQKPSLELIEENFFVRSDFSAIQYLHDFSKSLSNANKITTAYFMITSTCNFKCRYCFIESRIEENHNTFMTDEVVDKSVQLLKRNTKKSMIIFFGGEPLLNFKAIRETVSKTKEVDLKAEYTIITNGSIMTSEILQFIKEHKINIVVSIDGGKDLHDSARIDINNKGTYGKVISTLDLLKAHDISFGISCTVSPYNMHAPEQIVDILKKYDRRGFSFNMLDENAGVQLSNEERMLMVDNIFKAEEIIFDERIMEDRLIKRRFKPFVEKKIWNRDCAAYGRQITITPQGKIGPCHGFWPDEENKETKTYFDIDVDYQGQISEHPTWKEWNSRNSFNMPQCWGCYAVGICGGGCAKNSYLQKGDIWKSDENNCMFTKKSVPWVIWKYFDLKGGELVIS